MSWIADFSLLLLRFSSRSLLLSQFLLVSIVRRPTDVQFLTGPGHLFSQPFPGADIQSVQNRIHFVLSLFKVLQTDSLCSGSRLSRSCWSGFSGGNQLLVLHTFPEFGFLVEHNQTAPSNRLKQPGKTVRLLDQPLRHLTLGDVEWLLPVRPVRERRHVQNHFQGLRDLSHILHIETRIPRVRHGVNRRFSSGRPCSLRHRLRPAGYTLLGNTPASETGLRAVLSLFLREHLTPSALRFGISQKTNNLSNLMYTMQTKIVRFEKKSGSVSSVRSQKP